MGNCKLGTSALSTKLFVTLFLCLTGLSYITLLLHIWVDTEMKVSLVMQGYGTFEFTELVNQAHKYIFWFLVTWTPLVAIFLVTSFGEGVKRFFAVVPMLLIVSDVGSMWLIRYWNKLWFSWQLYLSGSALALLFFAMFLLINYDLWLKKQSS